MIDSRASLTYWGQRESVWRGQPRTGLVFCQDFSKGFSVHFGVKAGLGLKRLKYWMVSKATPALEQMAASTYFKTRFRSGALVLFRTEQSVCGGSTKVCSKLD